MGCSHPSLSRIPLSQVSQKCPYANHLRVLLFSEPRLLHCVAPGTIYLSPLPHLLKVEPVQIIVLWLEEKGCPWLVWALPASSLPGSRTTPSHPKSRNDLCEAKLEKWLSG